MENALLKEAIETLKQNKRPELVDCIVYGQYSSEIRTMLYSDSNQEYFWKRIVPAKKDVRSVKAFATLIKEELKRRENPTGNKATVKINLSGGYFIPDDNLGEVVFDFNRLNSQQWNLVKNGINKVYDHKAFLQFLQGLKPSIENFQEIFKSYSQLRLVGKSEITSNPMITEDGQNESFKCTYKLDNGCDGEEHFPTGFCVKVPFAKAGDNYYFIDLDLLFYRDERDNLRIEVLCPMFENIEEEAIIDEANYIKKETEGYSELLVLSDF